MPNGVISCTNYIGDIKLYMYTQKWCWQRADDVAYVIKIIAPACMGSQKRSRRETIF